MTYKQHILDILGKDTDKPMSCQEICKTLVLEKHPHPNFGINRYLSGGISTTLASMVKKGILEYAEGKGPRGGHLYKLKNPLNDK